MNISRLGVMVDVNRRISVGTSCLISILAPGEQDLRDAIRGTVRHTGNGQLGWRIGLEFERPLEDLEVIE